MKFYFVFENELRRSKYIKGKKEYYLNILENWIFFEISNNQFKGAF